MAETPSQTWLKRLAVEGASEHSALQLCLAALQWAGAERAYLVVAVPGQPQPHVVAVDCDGLALGHAAARAPTLAQRLGDVGVHREELDSGGMRAADRLLLRDGTSVCLILEHRFLKTPIELLKEDALRGWTTAAALLWRLTRSHVPKPSFSHLSKPVLPDIVKVRRVDEQGTMVQSLKALEQTGWNVSRAARELGITRHGLKKRMRRFGIQRPA